MPQTSANVVAGNDGKASQFNAVIADLAEIYAGGPGVPIGGVIYFWSNGTVPLNYKVCDGTAVSDGASPLNGQTVPDLRNKFMRGVANADIRAATPTGGSDTIFLTLNELPGHTHGVNDPSHNHGTTRDPVVTTNVGNNRVAVGGTGQQIAWSQGNLIGGNFTGVNTAATGGGQPFSILPAFTGLVPIMRIK